MSTLKELTEVLDDYLVDYAHPVDWTKFRQALREIREVLKELGQPDEELVEKYTKRFFDLSCDDLSNYDGDQERWVEAFRVEIRKLLQGRK